MVDYPSAKQTFTDPSGTNTLSSPDHAGLHTQVNDTVEVIQDVVGTTQGTNVLKNFAAGNFPPRVNSSNVLQHAISGTVTNSLITSGTFNSGVIGTPSSVGGTVSAALVGGTAEFFAGSVSNAYLGSPRIVLGSDAQGDVYYRNSGGSVARLAPGTSGQFLKTQGAAADPIWANQPTAISSKIITATRDISAASGTVEYTGVGFQPTSLIALANVNGIGAMGIGFSDSAGAEVGMEQDYLGSASTFNSNKLVGLTTASGAGQAAVLTSYETDGFKLTWTKTGSDTGTVNLAFLCYK